MLLLVTHIVLEHFKLYIIFYNSTRTTVRHISTEFDKPARNPLSLPSPDPPDPLPNFQYHGGRHRQLIHSYLDKPLRQLQVSSQFPTDARPLSVFMGIVHHDLYHPQDCPVMRIVKIIQLFILAVNGRVYCVRSLVPMLKKSTSPASSSLIITAAGVSTMIPCSGTS